MVVVLGSVLVREGCLAEAQAVSLEHVRRSRQEPGCISHAVHVDCENPNRLVFVEEWVDDATLQAHFRVPASRQFVADLTRCAAQPPDMALYRAEKLPQRS
ncbi:putative quinol monooxygenase [Curvibacter sp. APW13]|uniref:putative quinol monooxygenase n=1 Tax=Curvibacter sp. APW13 TaxID=3077236 RepID=UPI0028DE2240|nr:putative quinol monooxygenase [Curvibacter sp. APW13]MDT8991624.1 putative quinol monooxygenase [Curvibacter sp. APW13]